MHAGGEYEVCGAESDRDLERILAMQAENLLEALGAEERAAQGFVLPRHDLMLLREMNAPWPHLVATPRGSEELAAYALVMLREFRERLPLPEPMFERLERAEFRGRMLGSYRWYVMGRVCIAKAHRGRGLVERLYEGHPRQMSPHFDLMVTELDRANPRSLRRTSGRGLR